jgi:centromeric protein E
VGDLSEQLVSSINEINDLLVIGDRNRRIGETNMNEKSSRSHTIFRLTIESRAKPKYDGKGSGAIRVSLLNLVDLAGSERVGHTGAEGQRLIEGGHINKSLLALGTVISKLSEGDSLHIPYRDSKLTRILQSSLGGNATTSIVCTVTPAMLHIDETLSTLRFATRAKKITNRPKVNEVL